jgi:prolyl oligopeptidase
MCRSTDGRALGEIALPGLGTASGLFGRWDSNELFFDFTSFTIPRTTYRYNMNDGVTEVWSRDEVPFVSDKYEVHPVWYTSKDGTKVPMFLVYTKGVKFDGRQPTLRRFRVGRAVVPTSLRPPVARKEGF